jgi:hypothetical protein
MYHVVAAGVSPFVKPGILPGGYINCDLESGRQDAALYVSQEA